MKNNKFTPLETLETEQRLGAKIARLSNWLSGDGDCEESEVNSGEIEKNFGN